MPIKNDKTFCDENKLRQLSEDIIRQAKKKGATSAEINIATGSSFAVNVRQGNLDALEHSKGKDLSITLYFGKRTGTVSASDFKKDTVKLLLDKACHIAKFTQEDPFSGLADPKLMAYNYPDLDLYHAWSGTPDDAIALAKNCETECFACDKRINNSEGVTLESSEMLGIYANSHGFTGSVFSSRHSFSAALIATQKGQMQRDSYYTTARDFKDLESIQAVATKAAAHTVMRLGAKHITTRTCPVILHAEVAKTLIGEFIRAIRGSNLYHQASFLLDHLDKQVFPKHIHLIERPHILKALGSVPFDAEGVKLHDSDIITNGILKRYVLNSYAARKLKLKTTGNAGGMHNVFISTSDFDLALLQKKMHTGLLVTELLGDNVNIVTGDYSQGIFGYWIENGEIQYPVTNATIAGNLKDMFMGIVAIANDIDTRSNILTGSILIDKMMVAGR